MLTYSCSFHFKARNVFAHFILLPADCSIMLIRSALCRIRCLRVSLSQAWEGRRIRFFVGCSLILNNPKLVHDFITLVNKKYMRVKLYLMARKLNWKEITRYLHRTANSMNKRPPTLPVFCFSWISLEFLSCTFPVTVQLQRWAEEATHIWTTNVCK